MPAWPVMLTGWQITAAVALGASVASFGAGWAVRGWRCDAALLKAQTEAQKAFNDQLAHQQDESAGYETDRTTGNERRDTAATQIRTIYRDRIVSPDCALASHSVLQSRIDDENTTLAGEPRGAVPTDTATASDVP